MVKPIYRKETVKYYQTAWPFIAFLLFTRATAQEIPGREPDFSRFAQELIPTQTDGIDYQSVYDNLSQLHASPLDLNTVSRDELSATYLLTERQLTNLLRYRSVHGNFLSIYELQIIPDLDLGTIRHLLPFVTVDTDRRPVFGKLRNPTDHYLMIRTERVLERQKGFSPAEPDQADLQPRRYQGSPQQLYLRYRYSRPRDFSFGLTLEQDAGEPFRWRTATRQYGVDYVSFHAQVQNRGRWRNISLGDYQIQVGQGLVLSGGFSLGKGTETVAGLRRPTLGARSYTALSEYGFLRGATATYAIHSGLLLTVLASRNRRDANVIGDQQAEDSQVSSLLTSGLHRTPSEQADRGSLLEQTIGAHLLYQTTSSRTRSSVAGMVRKRRNNSLQLGLTVLYSVFDRQIQKRDQPYNRFEFTGKRNTVAGLHGNYLWKNVNLFGEVARSSGSDTYSGGWGAVGGAIASLTKRLDVSLSGRYYYRNFHSFYANAFGENTRNSNERGAYLGLRYVIYRKWTLGAFIDRFRFPWLKYQVDAPSSGFDYLVQAKWTPTKKSSIAGVYHEEHKEKNLPKSDPKKVVETIRKSYVLHADYSPLRGLSLKSRVQWGGFRYAGQPASHGLAIIQDATVDLGRVSLSGRLAWFRTDDYDSRQYVYERDVLYAFSIPAYFDQGLRHYLLVQYGVSRRLDVWLRWGRTDYRGRDTVGSDLDEINKSHKTEVKAQARWRF